MKTQIIVMILLVLSAKTITASNSFIKSDEKKSIIVNRGEWKSNNVNVQITDENGFTIFNQKLDKRIDIMKYNMSFLQEGKYFIEVSDDLRIVSTEFNVKRNQIVIDTETKTMFKPQIKTDKKHVDINLLSLKNNAAIQISDNHGNELYSETSSSMNMHKRMNVSALPSGRYFVSVKVGDKYFEHEFTK